MSNCTDNKCSTTFSDISTLLASMGIDYQLSNPPCYKYYSTNCLADPSSSACVFSYPECCDIQGQTIPSTTNCAEANFCKKAPIVPPTPLGNFNFSLPTGYLSIDGGRAVVFYSIISKDFEIITSSVGDSISQTYSATSRTLTDIMIIIYISLFLLYIGILYILYSAGIITTNIIIGAIILGLAISAISLILIYSIAMGYSNSVYNNLVSQYSSIFDKLSCSLSSAIKCYLGQPCCCDGLSSCQNNISVYTGPKNINNVPCTESNSTLQRAIPKNGAQCTDKNVAKYPSIKK